MTARCECGSIKLGGFCPSLVIGWAALLFVIAICGGAVLALAAVWWR